MSFEQYCEDLRQQSIRAQNEPFILVIQNGVAASGKFTRESQRLVVDKRKFIGMEVERLINKTKIHGGPE